MALRTLFLPLVLLATAAAMPLPLPTDAGTAIDRVLAAHGGKEALAAVQSYSFAGTLLDRSDPDSAAVEVPFTRTFSRPGRLRVSIDRAEGSEVRIFDGERGWRNSRTGGDPGRVEGNPLKGMALQTARAALPWILEEQRPVIRLAKPLALAVTGPDGSAWTRQMVVLEVPLAGGLSMKVLVDGNSYRIAGVGGYLDPADSQPTFETYFDRYIAAGGVLFPTHEKTFAGKIETGTQLITTITLNPRLKGAEFRP